MAGSEGGACTMPLGPVLCLGFLCYAVNTVLYFLKIRNAQRGCVIMFKLSFFIGPLLNILKPFFNLAAS